MESEFEKLVTETFYFLLYEKLLMSGKMGNVILSGHSGAYRVMAHILQQGGMQNHIKGVWLFDGLYSKEDKFLSWIQAHNGYFILN